MRCLQTLDMTPDQQHLPEFQLSPEGLVRAAAKRIFSQSTFSHQVNTCLFSPNTFRVTSTFPVLVDSVH